MESTRYPVTQYTILVPFPPVSPFLPSPHPTPTHPHAHTPSQAWCGLKNVNKNIQGKLQPQSKALLKIPTRTASFPGIGRMHTLLTGKGGSSSVAAHNILPRPGRRGTPGSQGGRGGPRTAFWGIPPCGSSSQTPQAGTRPRRGGAHCVLGCCGGALKEDLGWH